MNDPRSDEFKHPDGNEDASMTTPAPIGTAHHQPSKLDSLAIAWFAQRIPGYGFTLADRVRCYRVCETDARELIAELDRIEREKVTASTAKAAP